MSILDGTLVYGERLSAYIQGAESAGKTQGTIMAVSNSGIVVRWPEQRVVLPHKTFMKPTHTVVYTIDEQTKFKGVNLLSVKQLCVIETMEMPAQNNDQT